MIPIPEKGTRSPVVEDWVRLWSGKEGVWFNGGEFDNQIEMIPAASHKEPPI
jgi:hypothetical protein